MIVDDALIQRIEDAIAAERSTFGDGMAAFRADSTAGWMAVAGGRAIFTGAGFFSNRALGIGLRGPLSPDDVQSIEMFYAERGVPSEIEVASIADPSSLRLLGQLGYQLIRFRNIYAQTLHPHEAAGARSTTARPIAIHEVDQSTAAAWSTTLLDGFGYTDEVDRDRVAIWNRMVLSLPTVTALLALLDGTPVGAASVMVLGTTALLGGAATLPAFRRLGVHRALIEARLAVATHASCDLAIVTADPCSTSARNAERTGFQLVCNHVGLRAVKLASPPRPPRSAR